jgi:hypothetical protein
MGQSKETHGTFIPERVRIGFGIWTMLPIRDGRSLSINGQGMTARWRRFRVRGVDARAAKRADRGDHLSRTHARHPATL